MKTYKIVHGYLKDKILIIYKKNSTIYRIERIRILQN